MNARDIIIGRYSATEDGLAGRVPTRGGFPNRRTTLPGNLALILHNLSLTAFTFSEL
jgi:hypothetical protein